MIHFISKFLSMYSPKSRYLIAVICGVSIGLILFVIYISNALSYISDDPRACMNCHIMAPQYANWQHSSHRNAASCNECHVPHQTIFHHYLFKALDGARHSYVYTFRMEPQSIQMHSMGQRVVQDNCRRCHGEQLSTVSMGKAYSGDRKCWECHREVPHGRVNSLSSAPNARVPTTGSMIPEWLDELIKSEKQQFVNQ